MAERGRPRGFDREKALHQAMQVFWRKGFDSASLAELTGAMGINPPSLYAAFGSKEDLFREAVALYADSEGGTIWDVVETAPSARAAVAGMLRNSAEAFTRGAGSRGCMIALAAPQMQGASPQACAEVKRLRAGNTALLERRLKRAVKQGELPAETDCRAIAEFYATVQHGMSIQARDGASRKTLLGIAEAAMAGWDTLVGGPAKS